MEASATQIEIGPLTLSDVEDILAIQREIYPAALIEDAAVFAGRIAMSKSYCLGARSGEELVGYLIAHGWLSNSPPPINTVIAGEAPNEVLYIHDLGVSRGWEGSGVGRALVERAVDLAARDGIGQAQLTAVQGATTYWSRLGFVDPGASPELRAKLSSYGPDSRWMVRPI